MERDIARRLSGSPAAALWGPRQVGKTTLAARLPDEEAYGMKIEIHYCGR